MLFPYYLVFQMKGLLALYKTPNLEDDRKIAVCPAPNLRPAWQVWPYQDLKRSSQYSSQASWGRQASPLHQGGNLIGEGRENCLALGSRGKAKEDHMATDGGERNATDGKDLPLTWLKQCLIDYHLL